MLMFMSRTSSLGCKLLCNYAYRNLLMLVPLVKTKLYGMEEAYNNNNNNLFVPRNYTI